MTGAVYARTPNMGLGLLEFNFPNWGDDANANTKIIDAGFSVLGIAVKGAWTNSTNYILGDLVVDVELNSLWRCNFAHLSAATGTFADDRVAHPTYWTDASSALHARGMYTTATTYYTNDVMYRDANKTTWAMATRQFLSTTWDADVTAGNLVVIVDMAAFVAKSGDTMTGHLTLPSGPAAANAVRKDYVDAGDAAAGAANALKADIASPTFTGDPKAPTPSPGDNDTSIATTAYVTAAISAFSTSANASYVLKAGDTMTGDLTIAEASAALFLNKTAGQTSGVFLRTGANARWTMVSTQTVEGGSNAGSDLAISRYNDAGSIIDSPISIIRATGVVSLTSLAVTNGPITVGGLPMVGGATISDTAPSSPINGQFWWESDTGNLYVWYTDANSSQWLQVNGTSGLVLGTAEGRNRIVNPTFAVSQENGVVASGATGYYIADQWIVGAVHGGVHSAQSLVTGQYRTGGILQCLTIDASVAAGDELGIGQRIEGLDLEDFWWGNPVYGVPAVLRFTAWSGNAGTYAVSIRNNALDRSFVSLFTLPAGAWTEFIVKVPPCTDGTWPTDATRAAYLTFTVMSGTTSQTPTLNTWVNGPYSGHASMTNFMATLNNDFRVTAVGLYRDPNNTGVPPPWQKEDYAVTLAKCLRYWQQLYLQAWSHGLVSGASQYAFTSFLVTPRSTGNITGVNSAATNFPATVGPLVAFQSGVRENRAASGTVSNGGYSTVITVNARI